MKPDLVEIWHKATENGTKDPRESDYVCTLQSGYVCVKYTYIFNKAGKCIVYKRKYNAHVSRNVHT